MGAPPVTGPSDLAHAFLPHPGTQAIFQVDMSADDARAFDTLLADLPEADAVLLLNTSEGPLSADLPPGIAHKQCLTILLDPNLPIIVDHNTLARLYHLTAAESRLVQTLLQGFDINQSADRLCISPHTARSRLKAIFNKTGTHRQSELLQKMTVLSIHN